MKFITVLALCNEDETAKIKNYTQDRYDIRLITYKENDYRAFLDYINTKVDIILIENSINNKLYILKEYKDKTNYNKTIIVDDYKFECYKYIDNQYNLFNILKSDYSKEQLNICIDLVNKITTKNIPLYQEISNIIDKTNIPENRLGYQYLRRAIYESFNNPHLLDNFNKRLYPLLSKTYNKSTVSIEKAIRNSITNAMDNPNDEYNNKIFSKYMTYDKTPTNQEYILTIVNLLMVEYGKIT